jgi:hypothetical protein
MFRAVVSIAKAAVTDDPLSGFLAFLEVAARLARRHIDRSGDKSREGWLEGRSQGNIIGSS